MAGKNGMLEKSVTNGCQRITVSGLRLKLESQAFKCALTGRKLIPDTASVGHVLPLSRGGANSIDNVQIVDCNVNRAKGTMTTDEFIAMCREVVEYAERRDCQSHQSAMRT